jgi:hypothetical protein
MHAESLQELLLFGALLFACAALVQVLAERHLVGSYTVPTIGTAETDTGPVIAVATPQARAQERIESITAAPRGFGARHAHPIAHWAAKDVKIRRSVALVSAPGPAYGGQVPCGCGGSWRYNLDGIASSALWRCLHCGELHSGSDVIPEEED